ncbi:MAG TPA: extracellular solute-binding protein [Solirubrobacteraceae bacterium]|nr:extracellular solute-binding protein [Solirubrobacteraceae bacterium]
MAAAMTVVSGCGSDKGKSASKPTGSISVYAASSLQGPFEAIGKRFESANSGVKVNFRFGASEALFKLVDPRSRHARGVADVFATSDPVVIHGLSGNDESHGNDEVTGNANSDTIFVNDALEIVTAPGNPKKILALSDLAKPTVKVVLGSRRNKIGVVARNLLTKNTVAVHHAISAANAAGVVDAVASGRADAGIVYGSDAAPAGKKVAGVPIPESQNLVTDYEVALTLNASTNVLAKSFMTFLFTGDSRKDLADGGFQPISCSACQPNFPQ